MGGGGGWVSEEEVECLACKEGWVIFANTKLKKLCEIGRGVVERAEHETDVARRRDGLG